MRIAFVLAPALCAAVATSASAAVRPSVVPLDGVRASYLWTTSRHAPNGDSDGSAAVVLHGAPQGAMQVAVTIDGYDELYQAKSLADGTLDFVALKHEAPAPQLARLNQVARIAGAATRSEKVGDSWRVDLSEPVPGGTVDVQVVVHVTGADGDALVLEADGQAKGTIALPQPEVDPAGRGGGPGGPPGGPGGFPQSGAPQSMTGGFDDPNDKPKNPTLDVLLHVHLSARFADGVLVEARGSQVASPETGPKESIETDWALTKA